jgi:hypothetical protein
MESSLHDVWEAAAGNPFVPTVGKGSQFVVGFSLLLIGTLLTGYFGLSECHALRNSFTILTRVQTVLW